jgi:hypothetical protein
VLVAACCAETRKPSRSDAFARKEILFGKVVLARGSLSQTYGAGSRVSQDRRSKDQPGCAQVRPADRDFEFFRGFHLSGFRRIYRMISGTNASCSVGCQTGISAVLPNWH